MASYDERLARILGELVVVTPRDMLARARRKRKCPGNEPSFDVLDTLVNFLQSAANNGQMTFNQLYDLVDKTITFKPPTEGKQKLSFLRASHHRDLITEFQVPDDGTIWELKFFGRPALVGRRLFASPWGNEGKLMRVWPGEWAPGALQEVQELVEDRGGKIEYLAQEQDMGCTMGQDMWWGCNLRPVGDDRLASADAAEVFTDYGCDMPTSWVRKCVEEQCEAMLRESMWTDYGFDLAHDDGSDYESEGSEYEDVERGDMDVDVVSERPPTPQPSTPPRGDMDVDVVSERPPTPQRSTPPPAAPETAVAQPPTPRPPSKDGRNLCFANVALSLTNFLVRLHKDPTSIEYQPLPPRWSHKDLLQYGRELMPPSTVLVPLMNPIVNDKSAHLAWDAVAVNFAFVARAVELMHDRKQRAVLLDDLSNIAFELWRARAKTKGNSPSPDERAALPTAKQTQQAPSPDTRPGTPNPSRRSQNVAPASSSSSRASSQAGGGASQQSHPAQPPSPALSSATATTGESQPATSCVLSSRHPHGQELLAIANLTVGAWELSRKEAICSTPRGATTAEQTPNGRSNTSGAAEGSRGPRAAPIPQQENAAQSPLPRTKSGRFIRRHSEASSPDRPATASGSGTTPSGTRSRKRPRSPSPSEDGDDDSDDEDEDENRKAKRSRAQTPVAARTRLRMRGPSPGPASRTRKHSRLSLLAASSTAQQSTWRRPAPTGRRKGAPPKTATASASASPAKVASAKSPATGTPRVSASAATASPVKRTGAATTNTTAMASSPGKKKTTTAASPTAEKSKKAAAPRKSAPATTATASASTSTSKSHGGKDDVPAAGKSSKSAGSKSSPKAPRKSAPAATTGPTSPVRATKRVSVPGQGTSPKKGAAPNKTPAATTSKTSTPKKASASGSQTKTSSAVDTATAPATPTKAKNAAASTSAAKSKSSSATSAKHGKAPAPAKQRSKH